MKILWLKRLRRFIPFPKRKTLRRWFPDFSSRNLVWLMNDYGIEHVIDIGANHGQFAEKLRSAKWNGDILSFEPQAHAYDIIAQKSGKDKNWQLAPRMAVGEKQGNVQMRCFVDSSLSSILPLCGQLHSHIKQTVTEQVPVMPLDALSDLMHSPQKKTLLKIDVQGYELQVLKGAEQMLSRVEAIFIEVSLLPMYEGELHYLDMLEYLYQRGFHAIWTASVVSRDKVGPSTQMDVLLVRHPKRGLIPR